MAPRIKWWNPFRVYFLFHLILRGRLASFGFPRAILRNPAGFMVEPNRIVVRGCVMTANGPGVRVHDPEVGQTGQPGVERSETPGKGRS